MHLAEWRLGYFEDTFARSESRMIVKNGWRNPICKLPLPACSLTALNLTTSCPIQFLSEPLTLRYSLLSYYRQC